MALERGKIIIGGAGIIIIIIILGLGLSFNPTQAVQSSQPAVNPMQGLEGIQKMYNDFSSVIKTPMPKITP